VLIDLRELREPLEAFIRKSLADFSAEHPDVEVCTVGLSGDGFNGWAAMQFDTADHSAAFVEESVRNGSNWYGQDSRGRFCNSPYDFAYGADEAYFFNFSLFGYPDLYEVEEDEPLDFVMHDGTTRRRDPDAGDEDLQEIVVPLLRTTLVKFEPFAELRKSAPFRAGVWMPDSRMVEFWLVDEG
jgi:hypothetical protein